MHPLLVHFPAFSPQECPHPAMAVARVLSRELDHPLDQAAVPLLLATCVVALGGPGLPHHLTRPTLGEPKPSLHMLDSSSLPGRAQKFPRFTSFRTLMSTACSATIFLRRAFSFSSSLR